SEEAALGRGLWSGAEGDRTPDLRHAMAALSQLSYSPKSGDHGSEVIVLGHLDQSLLVVPGGRQPKVDCRQPGDVPDREVEASLERGAVHSNCVDLVRRVGGSDVSARRVAAGSSLYHDDVAVESTPLALHTKQPPPVEVEHQVVSAALLQWTQDENAELDGHRSNSGLRNRPLVARLHHEANASSPIGRNRPDPNYRGGTNSGTSRSPPVASSSRPRRIMPSRESVAACSSCAVRRAWARRTSCRRRSALTRRESL